MGGHPEPLALQDKVDEKKAQRTAPEQTKHRQQDMEL